MSLRGTGPKAAQISWSHPGKRRNILLTQIWKERLLQALDPEQENVVDDTGASKQHVEMKRFDLSRIRHCTSFSTLHDCRYGEWID